ncbi:MAG: tetratricopeptide repeat protein, partial [Armatimonadota bacterium]
VPAYVHARAKALEAAGGIAYWQGDMATAARFYEEQLSIQRELGDKRRIADALYNLSWVYGAPQTDLEKAWSLLKQSLALYEELGDRPGIARAHWSLGFMGYSMGNYPAAREHLAVSVPILRDLHDTFSLAAAEGRTRLGEKELDREALTAAWDEGRNMSVEELVAYALRRV